MSQFRRATRRQVLKAPQRAGFVLIRSKGSHHFVRHSDGRATVVPIHAGGEGDESRARHVYHRTDFGPGKLSKERRLLAFSQIAGVVSNATSSAGSEARQMVANSKRQFDTALERAKHGQTDRTPVPPCPAGFARQRRSPA